MMYTLAVAYLKLRWYQNYEAYITFLGTLICSTYEESGRWREEYMQMVVLVA
jgi:hypothetical protein